MDNFIEYYKKNNGTRSQHTLTAMKGNIKRVVKVLDKPFEDIKESDFKNVDSDVDKLV